MADGRVTESLLSLLHQVLIQITSGIEGGVYYKQHLCNVLGLFYKNLNTRAWNLRENARSNIGSNGR
jgi:hypothetical protein